MNRPEPTLGNPKNTIEILQKYKFVFQKKFGQNFLIDEHVLEKIISAAGIGRINHSFCNSLFSLSQ